jgi:hypothetical protein
MMTIMRMRCPILTIAYSIVALLGMTPFITNPAQAAVVGRVTVPVELEKILAEACRG